MIFPFIPENVSTAREEELDKREDCVIVQRLRSYIPPSESSDKNVWAYWRTGWETMPSWTQRCVIDWVRLLHSPSSEDPWVVRLLDSTPGSPNNVLRFVDANMLPAAFHTGEMSGPYEGAHAADLIRLPLLHRYGGAWIDVGMILIRHLDDIWQLVNERTTPYELVGMGLPLRDDEIILSNAFLATKRCNEYVRRWHQIYLSLWDRQRVDCVGLHAHPVLRHLRLYQPPAQKNAPEIVQSPEEWTDYMAHMLCGERLRDLIDTSDGFDGRSYYEHKVCLLPALREMYLFPKLNGWNGHRELETLTTRYKEPDDSDGHLRAKAIVCDTLSHSCMIKFSHGSRGSSIPWLAKLLNDNKTKAADHAPGTFAEYLRLGALHFRQTRRIEPLTIGRVEQPVWRAGLLECCGSRHEGFVKSRDL